MAAADAAFAAWSRTTPWQRAEVLDRAGTEVMARADELGDLLAREEGKTYPEARGEVVRAGQILKYFAGVALQPHGQALDSVRPGIEVTVTREPVGVVSVITPWNFPIAIPAWKIAPGARLRQHGGLQAGRPGAGERVGARRHPQSRRAAAPACSTSCSAAGRRWARC